MTEGRCKEDGARLFASGDQGQNKSQWTQGETQKVLQKVSGDTFVLVR